MNSFEGPLQSGLYKDSVLKDNGCRHKLVRSGEKTYQRGKYSIRVNIPDAYRIKHKQVHYMMKQKYVIM